MKRGLRLIYIGDVFKAIMLATMTHNSHYLYAIELALAPLGGVTEIGSFLFMSHHPIWPRQLSSDCHVSLLSVTVTSVITLTFANGNTAFIEPWGEDGL